MPYSIPKIGVIWQSYFQIKTLFVIFVSDNKTVFSPRLLPEKEEAISDVWFLRTFHHSWKSLGWLHPTPSPMEETNYESHRTWLAFACQSIMCLDSFLLNHCAIRGRAFACHKHYVHLASISSPISNEVWSVFHRSIDIVSFDSCCAAEMQSTPLLTKTISGVSS